MEKLISLFKELSDREKVLTIVALFFLLPLFFYQLVINPLATFQDDQYIKIRRVKSKIEKINSVVFKTKRLKSKLQASYPRLEKKIRSLLQSQKLLKHAKYTSIKGGGNNQKVRLELTKLNLTELTNLIYKIEHSKPLIIIEKADLKHNFKNSNLMKVKLELLSL